MPLFASEVDEVIEIETKHSKRRSAVNDPGKKKVFRAHPLTVEVCKLKNIPSKILLLPAPPKPLDNNDQPNIKVSLHGLHFASTQVVVPCDEGVHAKVLFTYLTKLRVVTVSISLMITTGSPWRDKFSVGT